MPPCQGTPHVFKFCRRQPGYCLCRSLLPTPPGVVTSPHQALPLLSPLPSSVASVSYRRRASALSSWSPPSFLSFASSARPGFTSWTTSAHSLPTRPTPTSSPSTTSFSAPTRGCSSTGQAQILQLLDAQINAFFAAMSVLKYDDVKLMISEMEWLSKGDVNETGAGAANVAAYNGNLIRCVLSGNVGMPRRPQADMDVYLFALLNKHESSRSTPERGIRRKREASPTIPPSSISPTSSQFVAEACM